MGSRNGIFGFILRFDNILVTQIDFLVIPDLEGVSIRIDSLDVFVSAFCVFCNPIKNIYIEHCIYPCYCSGYSCYHI
jgi:hypothetical protein